MTYFSKSFLGVFPYVLVLLLGLLLSACSGSPGPVDDDDSSDDDDTADDDDDTADDDDSAADDDDDSATGYSAATIERAGVAMPFMGGLIPWELLGAFLADTTTCPSKEDIDPGVHALLTGGGCTDPGGGVRAGLWDIVVHPDGSSTDTFTNWARSSSTETVTYWEMSGTMQRSVDGVITADVDLTLKYSDWAATQAYAFAGVAFDNQDGLSNAALGQAGGDYSAGGTVAALGLGTFTAQMTVSNLGACADELDLMTLQLIGELGTIDLSQTSDPCDGCTDWWTLESSGSYCH